MLHPCDLEEDAINSEYNELAVNAIGGSVYSRLPPAVRWLAKRENSRTNTPCTNITTEHERKKFYNDYSAYLVGVGAGSKCIDAQRFAKDWNSFVVQSYHDNAIFKGIIS